MKWGVVSFPGSNDERDTLYALGDMLGGQTESLWHGDEDLRGVDAVVLPGGFSYGDYLRCGAMARFSPVMRAVERHAKAGGPLLGICNGFQVLCEAGLLPGALTRNAGLKFLCGEYSIRVESTASAFSSAASTGDVLRIPVKHGEGRYVAEEAELDRLEGEGRVVFRYASNNPNGSMRDIAGIRNKAGNVVGLMPHPEHAVDALLGSTDGLVLFRSAADWVTDTQAVGAS
jgi:phosphoribosylformylglycinamidine synthase I